MAKFCKVPFCGCERAKMKIRFRSILCASAWQWSQGRTNVIKLNIRCVLA